MMSIHPSIVDCLSKAAIKAGSSWCSRPPDGTSLWALSLQEDVLAGFRTAWSGLAVALPSSVQTRLSPAYLFPEPLMSFQNFFLYRKVKSLDHSGKHIVFRTIIIIVLLEQK